MTPYNSKGYCCWDGVFCGFLNYIMHTRLNCYGPEEWYFLIIMRYHKSDVCCRLYFNCKMCCDPNEASDSPELLILLSYKQYINKNMPIAHYNRVIHWLTVLRPGSDQVCVNSPFTLQRSKLRTSNISLPPPQVHFSYFLANSLQYFRFSKSDGCHLMIGAIAGEKFEEQSFW